LLDIIE